MHVARPMHAVQSIAKRIEHPLIALARDFVVLLPFVKVKGEKLRHNGVDVLRAVDTRVLLYQGQDMLAMVLLGCRHHLNLMLSSFVCLSISFMWNLHGIGLRLPLHLVDGCICSFSKLLAHSPKFRWLAALLHLDHGLTTLTLQFGPSFWVKAWGKGSGPVQAQLRELILHHIRYIFMGQVILIMPQCRHHHRQHQRTDTKRNHFEQAKCGEMASRLSRRQTNSGIGEIRF
mmetsp:Transcript_74830/g.165249  ORF Transcript_74830/g.165249 Transcript_74830/m.165249 type:complete len:231 (-) Transcript_74830:8-700(-)